MLAVATPTLQAAFGRRCRSAPFPAQIRRSQVLNLATRAKVIARLSIPQARERAKAHSHIRKTVHPDARSARETARSRCAFRASFAVQNATRVFGVRPWRGQPCQKQPSTNTASFAARNMRSGLPGSSAPRRQSVMPATRSNAIKRSSVLLFFAARTRGTQWAVFEPNDEPLWARWRLAIGEFLGRLFRQGAFQGAMPREAYFVKCGRETTTPTDIGSGIIHIEVGFAPLKPAEFVFLRIRQFVASSGRLFKTPAARAR